VKCLIAPAALLLSACVSTEITRPQVAITVDDLPVHGEFPRGETPTTVARNVIAALKAENVDAYGFINGYWTEKDPATTEVLTLWRAAGLPLANHGWSHRHLSEMSPAEFEQELIRNEPLLRSGDEDWRWFRYPFLDEGENAEKRAAGREVLARNSYKIASVTMDFSDWAWTAPYARCRDAGDEAAVTRLEDMYMRAARDSIGYYRQLSRTAYGRDIPYVLLLHVSAFEARMLPRLLQLYRDEGFRFVSLAEAEADPAYADQIRPQLPAEPKGLEDKASRKAPLPQRTDYQPVLQAMCRG